MKKHSTGALTHRQKAEQDDLYQAQAATGVDYDYLFIGTGNASLTCATLLANAGHKVCMLEAHDCAGGYLHSFTMGPYEFCAQVHYIWGCGKGGRVREFLKHVGLEEDIRFDLLDPEGYDHAIMPDGKRVRIPYGWEALQNNIEQAYPQSTGLDAFFNIVRAIGKELDALPRVIRWWDYLFKGIFFRALVRYRHATLQDLFDACGVSQEAQTILSAQAGDLLLPPNKLSVLFYVALTGGYGTGAYHANPDFSHYVRQLVKFLVDRQAHLYFEERVTAIAIEDGNVTGISTASGKTFTAKHYVCGMDPAAAAQMIGWQHFPARARAKLNYQYSGAGVVVYLGLKPGFEPDKYGLGNHNTWHCFDWDMNRMWEAGENLNVEKSWLFISTPTMHSNKEPKSGHIIELATYLPYGPFKQAAESSRRDYQGLKMKLANKMIDLLIQHHVPDLRKHLAVRVVGSPTTNEYFCGAPLGNAYGAAMLATATTSRLTARTPFANFHWCNASSGVPSICGTVATGMNLYMDLTGDEFYDGRHAPTNEELISSFAFQFAK
jgi:all-trans-retinol 13,14-reductase